MSGTSGDVNLTATAAASARPMLTPSMVAERPVGEIPAGARAYFQPMMAEAIATAKNDLRTELGAMFNSAMNINFANLNKAMEDNKGFVKGYCDQYSVELIAKFDKIFANKSSEIESKITALETSIKETLETIKK